MTLRTGIARNSMIAVSCLFLAGGRTGPTDVTTQSRTTRYKGGRRLDLRPVGWKIEGEGIYDGRESHVGRR